MGKHNAARSKRPTPEDEPTFEPMRPTTRDRRAPSTDEKKIRRQMAEHRERSMTKADTTISARQRETDLLQAMASAGDLDTQRQLAAELEAMRSARITDARRAASVDLDALPQTNRWATANPAGLRTSMASDWIMDVPTTEITAAERDQKMIAEASVWYTGLPAMVTSDPEELEIQARGMASYVASQHGEDAEAAEKTFLAHVSALSGQRLAASDIGQPDIMPPDDMIAGSPETEKPMDTVNAPANTGPDEVNHSKPSDNPSLSEGTSPAGDSNAEPVSTNPTTNNAGDSGDPEPSIDNKPFDKNVLPPAGAAKTGANSYGLDPATLSPGDKARLENAEEVTYHGKNYHGHQLDPASSKVFIEYGDGTPGMVSTDALAPHPGVAPGRGAKRAALMQRMAVAWGRRHYEDLASMISQQPESEQLAKHFADHLMGTNPYYRRDQFQQAASTPGYQVRGGTGTANYSRGHYQHIANAIASYPGNKDAVAKAFANHFAQSNPRFKPEQFLKATQMALASLKTADGEGAGTAAPAPAAAPAGGDGGAADGGNAAGGAGTYQYQVTFKHPSSANYSETVTATNPEEAVRSIRDRFRNGDEASAADWQVKRVTSAVPEPDGLNAGVDFPDLIDPNDSMSLGSGDEGEWPAAPDGSLPQKVPGTPTASKIALFDCHTDRRVAGRVTREHELAFLASRSGSIWVDGDLMVIAPEIVRESYVVDPVREVYIGIDKQAVGPGDRVFVDSEDDPIWGRYHGMTGSVAQEQLMPTNSHTLVDLDQATGPKDRQSRQLIIPTYMLNTSGQTEETPSHIGVTADYEDDGSFGGYPSTSDDFHDYGNPQGGNTGGYEEPPPGVNPYQADPGQFVDDDLYDDSQMPEYDDMLGEAPGVL